jgi:hypothetical protein
MKLLEPLKVEWRSQKVARSKIHEYNRESDSDESLLVDLVLSREKSNAVIETVDEAEALAEELNHYFGAGEEVGRYWINTAVEKSCKRVQKEIIRGMESRGFETDRPTATQIFFHPKEGVEAVDEEPNEILVDSSDVLPGDLVRMNNDSIYRVVSRPREERDGVYTLRGVRHDAPSQRSERIYLGDVVRHVDREDEDSIHQEPPVDEEPIDVDEEDLEEAVERAERENVSLDDVLPRGVSTHVKKIPSGKKTYRYVYANWREGGKVRTKYVGPASRFGK